MNTNQQKNTAAPIDVSIIIVNYNTRDLLRDCLRSVIGAAISKEIIVVDNASTDGSTEMVRTEYPEVKLIVNKRNERFAKPNNTAIQLAKGRYLFLLNSDATLHYNTLQKLMSYMESHNDVGMCAPQLLFPDGTIQPSCRGFVTPWTHFCDMMGLDRLFPNSMLFAKSEMRYFDYLSSRNVDHVMAAAVIIRREVIESVGLFDEKLSINYNDLDLSRRLRKHGWKIVYYPDAKVIHHHSKTTRMLNQRFEMFDELYDNVFYYFYKHFGSLSVVFYKLMMIVGFSMRAVYWSIRSLFDPSEKSKYYVKFSLKSFRLALPFWKIE